MKEEIVSRRHTPTNSILDAVDEHFWRDHAGRQAISGFVDQSFIFASIVSRLRADELNAPLIDFVVDRYILRHFADLPWEFGAPRTRF